MLARVILTLICLFPVAGTVNAQAWSTQNGFLSVDSPDPKIFKSIPDPPPPFLSLWVSNDDAMKFCVLTTEIPVNIKLNQTAALEGLADEIGGTVSHFSTKQIAGHEVWIMSAQGEIGAISQAMVRHEDTLYKIMAASESGALDQEHVNRFIGSLTIEQFSSSDLQTQLIDKGIGSRSPKKPKGFPYLFLTIICGLAVTLAFSLIAYLRFRRIG